MAWNFCFLVLLCSDFHLDTGYLLLQDEEKEVILEILFGGSFNPVHIGHLIVAQDVLEALSAERVVFIPAYVQPLKGKLLFPPEIRLEMLKASINGDKRFSVWDIELKKGKISYTVETLRVYWKEKGRKPLFLMGLDSLFTFHLWKEPEEILNLSTLIVASRGDFEKGKIENYLVNRLRLKRKEFSFDVSGIDILSLKVLVLKTRRIDVSSTEIRERIREGKSIKYLVPKEVENIVWRSGCL